MQPLPSSFRDPAGFIYQDETGSIYRQVNPAGAADYDLLMSSGLYDALLAEGLLVSHRETDASRAATPPAHRVIQPEQIHFITYPFEWSFSQLQDAALATLRIQTIAMQHGMSLKDASAYNIQFARGQACHIDTLSFERYTPGKPWQAYRQYCQHFLAPLSLMAYTDINLLQLLRVHLDGIPLDITTRLLPAQARLRSSLLIHLFLHAGAQKVKAREHKKSAASVSQTNLEAIVDSLQRATAKLKPRRGQTEWGNYYSITNYSETAADQKAQLISRFIKPLPLKTAVDLGGNNGQYTRVLADSGLQTVCADIDPTAVEANYQRIKQTKSTTMLPLLVDLTNPGGALGWANTERPPVATRLRCDLVMALALIHHLAIGNNLPLEKVAAYFATFAPYLIIEFVPKSDSQVQKLLSTRADIFSNYHEVGFKKDFGTYYDLVREDPIEDSERTLYLFKRKSNDTARAA